MTRPSTLRTVPKWFYNFQDVGFNILHARECLSLDQLREDQSCGSFCSLYALSARMTGFSRRVTSPDTCRTSKAIFATYSTDFTLIERGEGPRLIGLPAGPWVTRLEPSICCICAFLPNQTTFL